MSAIRDYVMEHELFCHHDHHADYVEFDAGREGYDYASLLGYATADLITAEGPRRLGGETRGRSPAPPMERGRIERLWPAIRVTGYGRAVDLTCRALFDLPYSPEHWDAIDEALQAAIENKTAEEVYRHFVHKQAENTWTLHDGRMRLDNPRALTPGLYPASYRFAFRMDSLFTMVDAAPLDELEHFTGRSIHTLDDAVDVLNVAIDRFAETGELAAIKIGMAYNRDLAVDDPTHHEAELAFNRIRSRKVFWDGMQQNSGAVDAAASRALGDYFFHQLIRRADADNLPVQIHTGYLAGNWGSLGGTKAMLLIPILDKYRRVRFDFFHASWPWTSELGAMAKNYSNLWPDLCWAWAMNPTESARALSEWIDGVPFTKILGYGADTRLPWCNVGYSLQAKDGIAWVLEEKIARGFLSESTAREVADRIMLQNGEELFDLS